MSVRLFVDVNLLKEGTLVVDGEEHHYLRHVRRQRVGDKVELFDGEGGRAFATIQQIEAKQSVLAVASPQRLPEPSFKLSIAPSLIKGERMEQSISKMVELGVWHIHPMISERSIVRVKGQRASTKEERFRAWAKAASRQSLNPHQSVIHGIRKYDELLGKSHPEDILLIPCLSTKTQPLGKVLSAKPQNASSALVLIGPEGGFTGREIGLAMDAGFTAVSLGKTTLRAETACIAVASILQYHFSQ